MARCNYLNSWLTEWSKKIDEFEKKTKTNFITGDKEERDK